MPWLEDLKFPRGYQMGTHIFFFVIHVFSPLCILSYLMCAKSKQMKVHTQIHKYFKVYKNIASEGKKITHQ